MYTSWSEKYLARMGDSVAPEVMQLLGESQITAKNADTAISLVNLSLAVPRLIQRGEDRSPRNTLTLLDYLDRRVADSTVRAKIKSAQERLQSSPTLPRK